MCALKRSASRAASGPFDVKRRALGAPSGDAGPTAARSPSAAKQPAPPPAAARSSGVRFGSMDSYERIKKIGEGAFGTVSKARHLGTGEVVAIKTVLEGGSDEELLREARILALCGGNPAVVALREVARCPETNKLCLVMEFVGPSLLDELHRHRRRRRGRAFSEWETCCVMRQLLVGVEAMHAQGVVHRDLKPGNVLVGERDRRVRICDLGLGKAMAKAPPHTQSVGTLWYMAPELLREEEYGAPVDLWSLGCVMGELLTGQRLFDERSEDAQLWTIADKLGVSDDGSPAATPSQLRDMVPEDLLSQAGFDVLRGLLEYDCGDRLTAAAALQMPWFTSQRRTLQKKRSRRVFLV